MEAEQPTGPKPVPNPADDYERWLAWLDEMQRMTWRLAVMWKVLYWRRRLWEADQRLQDFRSHIAYCNDRLHAAEEDELREIER